MSKLTTEMINAFVSYAEVASCFFQTAYNSGKEAGMSERLALEFAKHLMDHVLNPKPKPTEPGDLMALVAKMTPGGTA